MLRRTSVKIFLLHREQRAVTALRMQPRFLKTHSDAKSGHRQFSQVVLTYIANRGPGDEALLLPRKEDNRQIRKIHRFDARIS